jgi:hypothetical protein
MLGGAQQVDSTHLFLGAARLPGQPPSLWVSDIAVNNLQDEPIEIGLLFFPERTEHGMDDILVAPENRFILGPRETRLFQDVLGTVFGVQEDKGVVVLTTEPEILGQPPGEDEPWVVATMRTYDVSSPQGTYGQTILANAITANSSDQQSFVTGAVHDGTFRSNLGILNVSLEPVRVYYRVFSTTAIVAEGMKTLGSLEFRQYSFNNLGVATVEGPLTLDLWLHPEDVRPWCLDMFEGGTAFIAYVSKVDSRTQDAEFIYAAPAWVNEIECDND